MLTFQCSCWFVFQSVPTILMKIRCTLKFNFPYHISWKKKDRKLSPDLSRIELSSYQIHLRSNGHRSRFLWKTEELQPSTATPQASLHFSLFIFYCYAIGKSTFLTFHIFFLSSFQLFFFSTLLYPCLYLTNFTLYFLIFYFPLFIISSFCCWY